MSGVKRTAEEMSSSDDDDCVFLYEVSVDAAPASVASPTASPPAEHESSPACEANTTASPSDSPEVLKKRKLDLESFQQFLDQNIPTKLLPAKSSAYIVGQANLRLQQAREDAVNIKDIAIGEDCLPTWEGLHWDSEEESLHAHLQDRLMDFEMSQDVGFLRTQVIKTWKRKWEQACALGVGIGHVWIGSDLLPQWKMPGADEEHMETDSPNNDPEHTAESNIESEPGSTENDTFFSLSTNSSSSKPTTAPSESDGNTAPSSVSSHSSTASSDEEDDEDFDDVISLDNFVDAASCEYEEYEEEELENIFHEAEIVDAPPGYQEVDLEVFLVDGDDPELDDMPEIEFGIDRLGFEMYYDTEDAVDIDIPGVDVRTTTNLPPTTAQLLHILEQQERQEQEQEERERRQRLERLQRVQAPLAANRTRLLQDETINDLDVEVQYPYESDSDASEEVTSDEDAAPTTVEVQETEDGFVW